MLLTHQQKTIQLIEKTKVYLFLAAVFFLPVYQTLNHWFFGFFLFCSLLLVIFKKQYDINFKEIKVYLIFSCISFFLIRVVTMLYAPDTYEASKEITRALPFLMYPLAILDFRNIKNFDFNEFEKKVFFALAAGCSITAILAWSNTLVNMPSNPVPAEQFFGWKKSGIYLTAFLDLHPPYLGLLISASIIFIYRELITVSLNFKSKILLIAWSLVLVIFMFHLTSRNALFFLIITGFIFFIYKSKWRFLLLLGIVFSLGVVIVVTHPSKYYRLKMYHMLGLSDNDELKDKRFNRLTASYNVFKISPVLGVGVGVDTELKVNEYLKLGETIAAKKRLNSHNQFFEYLAAYGIIGGIVFIIAIIVFFKFLISHKLNFYLLLFLSVVFASLTESIFERALGIQYFSIIVSMAMLNFITHFNPLKECSRI